MSGENVVSIVVKSTDDTKAGFEEARASADEAGAGMDEYAAAVDRAGRAEEEFRAAQAEAAGAQARLDELSRSGTASADELAAAQDRVAQASLRSMDAQLRLGEADARVAEAERAAGAGAEEQAAKNDTAGGLMAGAGDKVKMAALGVAVGLGAAVKAAADFQDSTTHLVTDAGESAKNLAMVQQGILAVSAATGTSAKDITSAMYHIESGGYHGAAGLALLKVAAEGAKVGGADLDTVSRTLVGTMNAYGMSAGHAASFMNELIATVGAGDMRMQDLASSLSAVAPLAAAVHISFAQVGGAIATMTAQGMSAQQATQDLANTIRSLSNPNNVAIGEMNQLGVNAQDVSQHLGQRGLTGTIQLLTQAILSHMGRSGQVMMSAFTQSTTAGNDLKIMLGQLPASLQGVAKGLMDGSVSAKQWRSELQAQDPVNQHLMTQFAALYEKSHSFNSILAAGGPAAQTYEAALAKMMGGATGLNTALMLSGSRMAVFKANTAAVADAAKKGGGQVDNWSVIQGTFNFKLQQAKTAVEDMGISLGSALLPAVTAVVGPIAHMLALIASNKAAATALAVVAGGLLAGALGSKLAGAFKGLESGIKGTADAVEWLIGKLTASTAATEAQTAATEAEAEAQETADAAMDANPVGLIILAITVLIAAIVLLVTHWHDVETVAKAVFKAVEDAAKDTVGWVKGHWELLLAILTGPIGMAALFIKDHWAGITKGAQQMYHDVLHWFDTLGHDIGSFFDRLASDLFNAGKKIIQFLARGISAAIGDVEHAVGSVVDDIKSFLPFSPARKGPLSGSGAPEVSGQRIAAMLAQGMESGRGAVQAAASHLAGAAGISPGGGMAAAGAAGGPVTIRFELAAGASGLDALFWRWFQNGVRIQGGDPRIVNKKVQFTGPG